MWCLSTGTFPIAIFQAIENLYTYLLLRSFSPLHLTLRFGCIRPVKFAASLLLLFAFAFTGCNTLATRRSLYRQNKGSGPYTRQLKEGVTPNPTQAKPRATPFPKETETSPLPQ